MTCHQTFSKRVKNTGLKSAGIWQIGSVRLVGITCPTGEIPIKTSEKMVPNMR